MKDLLVAINASLDAGRAILTIYNDPNADFEVDRKADNSPLTIADRTANGVIVKHLEETKHPILSEEGRAIPFEERKSWQNIWVVDPLDGTKEFIKKNGEFTVNIALISEGNPVLGVIYVPVKEELFFGTSEIGAFKITNINHSNTLQSVEEYIKIAEKLPLNKKNEGYIAVASRSHMSVETVNFLQELESEKGEITCISSGSSIKICLVAEGSADIYPRFAPTMEWDTAAGDAIARAAGCSVCNAETSLPLTYNKRELLNPWFIVRKS